MTIAVSIKTGSAVVFAADSKVTTQSVRGRTADGELEWVNQTFDHAFKTGHDRNQKTASDLEDAIRHLLEQMQDSRQQFWRSTQVEPRDWPSTTVILAAADGEGSQRIFSTSFSGAGFAYGEIQRVPGINVEGSYRGVFTLLYGVSLPKLNDVAGQLQISPEKLAELWFNSDVLEPIDKINMHAMPVQDAMELAHFLVSVQIQMDRFLPGDAACGGPVDLMVLEVYPEPHITSFLGKSLHYPGVG